MIEQFELKSQIIPTIDRLEKSEYNELNSGLEEMMADGEVVALEEQVLRLERVVGEKEGVISDQEATIKQANLQLERLAKMEVRNFDKLNYLKSVGVRRVDDKFKHENFTVFCNWKSGEVGIEYLSEHKAPQHFHESSVITRLLYDEL